MRILQEQKSVTRNIEAVGCLQLRHSHECQDITIGTVWQTWERPQAQTHYNDKIFCSGAGL